MLTRRQFRQMFLASLAASVAPLHAQGETAAQAPLYLNRLTFGATPDDLHMAINTLIWL